MFADKFSSRKETSTKPFETSLAIRRVKTNITVLSAIRPQSDVSNSNWLSSWILEYFKYNLIVCECRSLNLNGSFDEGSDYRVWACNCPSIFICCCFWSWYCHRRNLIYWKSHNTSWHLKVHDVYSHRLKRLGKKARSESKRKSCGWRLIRDKCYNWSGSIRIRASWTRSDGFSL